MSHAHKRKRIEAVVANRAALALAAPFQKNIDNWQSNLAHLRVVKSSPGYSDDQHLQARIALGELLAAVLRRRIEFNLAIEDRPMTGALGDLERSLARLTEDLSRELRS